MKKVKKLKVGFFGITGCAGCLLSVIFNEDDFFDMINLVNIHAFPFIKEVNANQNFDYVFLEGLIADNEDMETAKKLRKNTKYLVSFGACACTGCVPAYRNYTLKENYEHLIYKKERLIEDVSPMALNMKVQVDYNIPGCPPDKIEIKKFLKNIALGLKPKEYKSPVCFECRKNGNHCLLESNKPCIGPITVGGCDAVCINNRFECWGCRGPTDDINLKLMINILKEKGFDDNFIKDRLRTFAGLKLPMLKEIFEE